MTNEEIAKRMRKLADTEVMNAETRRSLWQIADELDPPEPKIPDGTIAEFAMPDGTKAVGYKCRGALTVRSDGVGIIAKVGEERLMPIRALGPGQVAVDRQAIVDAEYLLRSEIYTYTADALQAALNRDTEVER